MRNRNSGTEDKEVQMAVHMHEFGRSRFGLYQWTAIALRTAEFFIRSIL